MKNKIKNGYMTFAIIAITLCAWVGYEESMIIHPKELTIHSALADSVRSLTYGKDPEEVKDTFIQTAQSVGINDIEIEIEGIDMPGQVIELKVNGNIEADTIARRIIHKTELPIKASMKVIINS